MKIVNATQLDRGLAYAEACFETFRVIDGAVFDWPGHWRRLSLGLSEFGLLLPAGYDEELLFACLRQAAATAPDALLRLTISGGAAGWGLANRAREPVAHIQCAAYAPNPAPQFLRLAEWPFPLRRKTAKFTADYSDTLRAMNGADDAQLLFAQQGRLLAAATANILLYRNGAWHTPPAEAGVLPGRVRDFLLARGLVRETRCPLAWLKDCEAMAVCNSGLFIRPVALVDGCDQAQPPALRHAALDILRDALKREDGVPMDINRW